MIPIPFVVAGVAAFLVLKKKPKTESKQPFVPDPNAPSVADAPPLGYQQARGAVITDPNAPNVSDAPPVGYQQAREQQSYGYKSSGAVLIGNEWIF